MSAQPTIPCSILFHEPWWLSAVTSDRYEEVTVEHANQMVGRLPFTVGRRYGFTVSILPPFTHMLGPAIAAGAGKPNTQLTRRLSVARSLIDKLPAFAYFMQIFDPNACGGFAAADGLAFQDRGYDVRLQYTFHVDLKDELSSVWDGMQTTARQHIRRADEVYQVSVLEDPERFVCFYLNNLRKSNRINRTDFANFNNLFVACRSRNCGEILSAALADGSPVAMVFLVWGHGTMYYLLSTRAPDADDKGATSLLLWSAIKRAHERRVGFDFDGIYSSGTARFLSGFGGKLGVRLVATRTKPFYGALRQLKSTLRKNESDKFT
jgi:hypothetical protein